MDAQQTDRFRKQLLEQRASVASEMEAHRITGDPVEDRERRDPEEQAVNATASLVETRITEDDENLLKKIDLALERLDAGTYQQCANCGKKIPLARLRAKPSASLCLNCQEDKDAGRLGP
ncbi:TraR/DksA family transcriptional regulator [Luteolibacter marinus]|uniref:TraR/DksA family transcriptional regulator n=1 Tax=Luteolibacter marinus TaxID=2776705 RepID=UPI0018679F20|nr:TraR/DksA C4-type zinc finger protein [Luteolibacter marinus]